MSMEVDPPTSSSSSPVQNSGSLKRSNSAPMINMLVTSQADISSSTLKPATCVALRRLSSSNMNLHGAPCIYNTSPPIRGTDRVARIKQEEIHIADRERQHEREIQSSFWISNNWDHISLDGSETIEGQQRRPRSFSESLHIMTQSSILCGSPSPTRAAAKQCFSPSMQIPIKSTTFTPSPSPSPTRKNFLRSLSPIAVRSGALKRKCENDGERWEYISPPKKFNTGPSTPDRIMTCSHPLAGRGPSPHSTNNNHGMDTAPPQMLSKRAFLFRPVQDIAGPPHPCSSGSSSSSGGRSSGMSSLSSMSLDNEQRQLEERTLDTTMGSHHHHHHSQSDHADMGSDSGNHTSSDIYMSD